RASWLAAPESASAYLPIGSNEIIRSSSTSGLVSLAFERGLAGAAPYYGAPVRAGRYVVVIVDDHALFSRDLALLLESRAGDTFVVAGSTTAGEEAVALVGREAADIAIVDLALPPRGGGETIRRSTAAYPHARILA